MDDHGKLSINPKSRSPMILIAWEQICDDHREHCDTTDIRMKILSDQYDGDYVLQDPPEEDNPDVVY